MGPTSPALATGALAPNPPAVTTGKVTATIGGLASTVTFSGLAPGFVGSYTVKITVPADLPSGDLPVVLNVGGISSQAGVTAPIIGTSPVISSVSNAASGNIQTLPNGGEAQGAVFVVTGTNLGPSIYYNSAGQVAGVLPSNVPVGAGT